MAHAHVMASTVGVMSAKTRQPNLVKMKHDNIITRVAGPVHDKKSPMNAL